METPTRPSSYAVVLGPGYYARHVLLEGLVRAFAVATAGASAQLLILGAGFDTRALRYRVRAPPLSQTGTARGRERARVYLSTLGPPVAVAKGVRGWVQTDAALDHVTVFEVDFAAVTRAKIAVLTSAPPLAALWPQPPIVSTPRPAQRQRQRPFTERWVYACVCVCMCTG
jgi:hypothetical protein